VALDLRPAAVPSRLLAGVLDGTLQLLLFFGLAALQGAVTPSVSPAASSALGLVLFVVVGVGYPAAFETLLRGRTPGKMALGLRVVRDDGGPVGFRQAIVRALAGLFLERPGVTFFLGAIVTMALNGRGKRIGDLLAGTVVLQERVAVRGGPVAMMPPELAAWASGADLSGVGDDLALSARQLLARSAELTPAAREDLGGRLVATVLAVVSPPPPPGTPGWAVLSAVLAERRRREETRLGAGAPGAGASGASSPWGPTPAYGPTPEVGPAPVVRPLDGARPSAAEPHETRPSAGPGGFAPPG